ncbi:hypothetical protein PN36_31415 [Candidatus Thiomargarita nelsonii]|uniref:Uncharacterized protein n=1 Tax=Candidatus Thiomargarita nelsonii TaxID=1003181 RepID=A0A0A6P9Y6_9GAMM|nr:hypothetical protein PN36_31415 [Candidatus Thiomargarita nelsonii]
MTIKEFMMKYSLYGSVITAWNWAKSHRLVLELDLSNLNQNDYTEDQDDFRPIILIFENCTIVDELNEGFDGFSNGDARIIEASTIRKSASSTAKQGIKLVMMHDNYDVTGEKLVSVIVFAKELSMIVPDAKY